MLTVILGIGAVVMAVLTVVIAAALIVYLVNGYSRMIIDKLKGSSHAVPENVSFTGMCRNATAYMKTWSTSARRGR